MNSVHRLVANERGLEMSKWSDDPVRDEPAKEPAKIPAMRWRVACYACGGEGVGEGCTCWDDTCCCLDPEPPECDICNGEGSFIITELTDDNCDNAVPVSSPAT
jgi:hypothetical protein